MSIETPVRAQGDLRVIDEEGQLIDPNSLPEITNEKLTQLMERMLFTRLWDERAIKWTRQGKLGFYAPVSGQEAAMIGSEAALSPDDFILPSYRDVPQAVWHGWPLYQAFLYSFGHQQGNQIPEGVHTLPPQIIIGAQVVQAAGVAMAFKLRKEKRVALAYIGDGGTSQGDFYEGMNVAGVYRLPLILMIQNNQFAISVPVEKQTAVKELAKKAEAAGIEGKRVDGMDVLAVYKAVQEAVQKAKAGGGPTMIEALTFRYGPHTMSGDDPGRYRTKELEHDWRARDPLVRFRKFLQSKGLWTEEAEQRVEAKAKEEVQASLDQANKYPAMTLASLANHMYGKMPRELARQVAGSGLNADSGVK